MKKKEIRKLLRDVEEAGDPEERRIIIAEKRQVLANNLKYLNSERSSTLHEAQDWWTKMTGQTPQGDELPRMGLWERTMVKAKRMAAFVFTSLDIPISVWMWQTALIISKPLALAVGILWSVGIAFGTHLGLLSYADDRSHPLRSIRICRSTSGVAGIVTAFAGAVVFFMRNAPASSSPAIELLLPGALWILSIALPLFAGSLFAWSVFQGKGWWYTKKISRLDREIFETEQALFKLNQWESGNHSRSSPMAAVMGILWTLIIMPTNSVQAEELLLYQGGVSRNQKITEERVCELWIDQSTSVDPDQRVEALRQISENLSEYVKSMQCLRLRIGHFYGDEGRFAKFKELELPREPDISCTRTPSKYEIFRSIRDFEQQKAERECSAQRQEIKRKFELEWSAVIEKARAMLLQDKRPNSEPKCTDIINLLRGRLTLHLATPNTITMIWLVSDGISDCQIEIPPVDIPPAVQVFLLLIRPDRKAISSARHDDWVKRWERIGITLIPFPDFIPSRIHDLAQQHGIEASPCKEVQNER